VSQIEHYPCYILHCFLRFRAFKVDVQLTYYILHSRKTVFTGIYCCSRYIAVPTDLNIYFPAYFRMAKRLQHTPRCYFNSFLGFRAFKVDVLVTWYKSTRYGAIRIIHNGEVQIDRYQCESPYLHSFLVCIPSLFFPPNYFGF
jgi:hypothetical protein